MSDPEPGLPLPADDGAVRVALHELRVHQLELELQNEELQRQRQRYQDLYDLAPVGYFSITESGAILEVNLVGANLLGHRREELIGRRLVEFVDPTSASELRTAIERLFSAGRATTGDVVLVAEDDRHPTVVSIDAVVDPDLGTAFVVAVDLTARRAVERREVEVSALALDAERARVIAQLAGGVAHDLNNLLTVVLGYTELVAGDSALAAPTRAALVHVTEAAERAAVITGQLLAFGRRQQLHLEQIEIGAFLDASRSLVSALCGGNVRLEIEKGEAPRACVLADANQLTQVLLNLAANSRDAMPDGGRLTLGFAVREVGPDETFGRGGPLARGRYVRIDVADGGYGMDAATLARLGEPFFTTKERGQGTGLGLAAVDGIIAQLGGRWAVESTPGEGTRVVLLLPEALERRSGEAATVPRAPARPDTVAPAGVPAERGAAVLVVDDEAALVALCRLALLAEGYDVAVAHGPTAALAELGVRAFDLVVSDVAMPEMDGFELARRARLTQPEVRFLFISGYAFGRTLTEELAEGDGFLEKPFSLADFVDTVASFAAPPASPGS